MPSWPYKLVRCSSPLVLLVEFFCSTSRHGYLLQTTYSAHRRRHGLPSNLASHYYHRTSHRTNYQCKFIGKYNTPAKERTSYLLTNYLGGVCILCYLCNKHYQINRPCWDVHRRCKIWEEECQYIPGITTHWAVQWHRKFHLQHLYAIREDYI